MYFKLTRFYTNRILISKLIMNNTKSARNIWEFGWINLMLKNTVGIINSTQQIFRVDLSLMQYCTMLVQLTRHLVIKQARCAVMC